MSDRADILESLLQHPGWKLFLDHVKSEWSPAACWRKVREEAGDLAKVDYTNGQVGLLVEWPAQEMAKERRERPMALPMSRRGGL